MQAVLFLSNGFLEVPICKFNSEAGFGVPPPLWEAATQEPKGDDRQTRPDLNHLKRSDLSNGAISMEKRLDISHYVLGTKVLGPYIRSALWVHGCCFDCEGCLAYEMNRRDPDLRSIAGLAQMFAGCTDTEGITISGGEPFMQAEGLAEMLDIIKQRRDYGVIIYTGFTLEKLSESCDGGIKRLLGMTDILIDGQYRKDEDDGLPYRGSSNQRIILLSDRYKDQYESYYLAGKKRDIEINFDKDRVNMVGVPSAGGLKIWKDLIKRAEGNGEGI